ncbi:MAG: hypothetical protein FWH55_05250 [Oscillospiraceae bacterium]|nr:hypothetical protein [Oscillospiraceae bacterium]
MSTNEVLFQERLNRILSTVAFEKTDRVPIAPKIGSYYANAYGISMFDVMINARLFESGVRQFFEQFQPDLAWAPLNYPIPPMELLDAQFIKWPGGGFGIPLNKGYQILDGTYIEDDEFSELIFDPTQFFLTKLYPRKFKALKGLSKINLQYPVEFSQFINLLPFGDPEVKEALLTLMHSAVHIGKWFGDMGYLTGLVESLGFPVGAKFAVNCSFDMFADNIRGIMRVLEDMRERPEELLEILGKFEAISIQNAVGTIRATGAKFCFIPLHNGVDEFMSRDEYLKFYWPGLKNLMLAIIEEDCVPYVFCEGKYATRLDIISDIPKGKVIYLFEETDIKLVKETVGKVACICGNLPTASLMFGSKQQVIDETKEMIEICAPGGGFIMDNAIGLEEGPFENLQAMFDTTLQYGKY